MDNIILSKNEQKYTRAEWVQLVSSGEADLLLKKYGPAYTEEAWLRNRRNDNVGMKKKKRKY